MGVVGWVERGRKLLGINRKVCERSWRMQPKSEENIGVSKGEAVPGPTMPNRFEERTKEPQRGHQKGELPSMSHRHRDAGA